MVAMRRDHDQQPGGYIELEQSLEGSFSLTVHKSLGDAARNNQVVFTHDGGYSPMVRDALEALFIVLGGNLDSIPATVELRGAMPEGSLLKIQCTTSSDIIVSTHPNNISNLFFPSTVSQDIIACLLNLYDAISQDNINHPRGNE